MINVIYEKDTRRVFITEEDGVWVLPDHLDIVSIKGDTLDLDEIFDFSEEDDVYLKPDTIN